MFRKCAWCQKDLGEIEPLEDKNISHGICPDCFDKELADLEAKYRKKEESK